MSDKKRSAVSSVISTIIILVVLSAGAWLFFNRAYAQDQMSVWNFKPSADVVALNEDLELADKGEFYFYASAPQIDDASEFNANCPQREVNNPILGCYSNGKIYIYNVTEDDLAGIQEVTAAHEMLHAVWERHSQSEKDRIGELLKTAYKQLQDEDLESRMAYYERNEPGELVNELHSIIGTEERTISPELEEYYRQYFDDRGKIVTYHDQYDRVFTELRDQLDALYDELTVLGEDISSKRSSYKTEADRLTVDIQSFNQRANEGSFSSESAFYRERNEIMARIEASNAELVDLNNIISVYNGKYETYQTLASRIQQLNSSIDSMEAIQEQTPEVIR